MLAETDNSIDTREPHESAATRQSKSASEVGEIRVWDIFVRVFHWSLVVAFLVAYVSEDISLVHVWAGYLVGTLVILRILWGFVGTRYARFSNFVYRPRKVFRYTLHLLGFGGRRYLGHSPAGGAMVLALLVIMLLIVSSGLITLAMSEGTGLLSGGIAMNPSAGRLWKEAHELLADAALVLVLLHICGVLWASLVHGENLTKAMWDGKKRSRDAYHPK